MALGKRSFVDKVIVDAPLQFGGNPFVQLVEVSPGSLGIDDNAAIRFVLYPTVDSQVSSEKLGRCSKANTLDVSAVANEVSCQFR